MVHHANRLRPNVDRLKIGGHRASSASVVSIMTALYGMFPRQALLRGLPRGTIIEIGQACS